ncbi:MAG: hypothetical protein M1832_004633 [Thelocarpon impressellum]|nr:MAG: hypothetical protein M1832_004633 [Thelocarpon impressellum]
MVTLDAPSLGQPSDVIILRDAALRHRHKPVALPADESSTNITAHNLLASMNSEGGLIGEEEVKANIDKIRPTSPGKSLSQREFEMLKKALSDGFTSHQLARVTADKDTANLVVRDIRSILRNIQYMELDLGPFKVIDDGRAAQAVDLLMLDSIAQITGTEIKLVDDDKLGVHSLGPDSTEADDTTKTLKEQIRICLRPSPWSSLPRTTITSFPGLEVTLDLSSESKEPRLHAVCATLSEQQVDVMLPYQPADLRFTRRTEFSLEARRPVQSIADFLARSYLNIRGQGRLRTPSTLVVPLPRWALAHADARSDEDVTEVEYLFTGLEHRQTLDIVHEGWRAQYTSVEAGKTGGRRCELRVLMEKGGDVGGEASGALDFGEFYAAAVGLVERLATRTRKAL